MKGLLFTGETFGGLLDARDSLSARGLLFPTYTNNCHRFNNEAQRTGLESNSETQDGETAGIRD